MKIISPFKDYYDSIAYTYGIDNSNVYVRQTRTEKIPELLIKDSKQFGGWHRGIGTLEYAVLGFAGKLYLTKIISEKHQVSYYFGGLPSFYNVKDLSKLDIEYLTPERILEIDHRRNHFNQKQLSNLLEQVKSLNLFQKYDCPCFLLLSKELVINPILKEQLKFQNILSPEQAYQELEMFMTTDKSQILPISDSDKIIQHGFDLKTSFRKDKL